VTKIYEQLEYLANLKAGTPWFKYCQRLTRQQISILIEIAFWATLRTNEGRSTRVRLAVAGPDNLPSVTEFASPLPYEQSAIVKLAPAVPIDCFLGIALANETFQIWGFAHSLGVRLLDTVTIQIAEPGIVRVDVGPFHPYAILDGQSNNVIAATGSDLAWYLNKRLAKSFPNDDFLETQAIWRECLALADLVRMILIDGHGGAVLLVPSELGEWSHSLTPFPYRLKTPDTSVRDAIRKELSDTDSQGKLVVELSQTSMSDDLKNRVLVHFHRATTTDRRELSGRSRHLPKSTAL